MREKKDSRLQPASQGRLRIGPAGWSYPDWSGFVYPSHRSKNFHEATFLAQFFDTIEINTSFYQPIHPEHAAGWIERVAANPSFLFTAKLWQRFTHEPSATTEDERNLRSSFHTSKTLRRLSPRRRTPPFFLANASHPRSPARTQRRLLQHRSTGDRQLRHSIRAKHLVHRLRAVPRPPL